MSSSMFMGGNRRKTTINRTQYLEDNQVLNGTVHDGAFHLDLCNIYCMQATKIHPVSHVSLDLLQWSFCVDPGTRATVMRTRA
ncbi:hypothetical protein PAXRUDRAFT_575712 [Paxillus rubicundulus Ve08.2h10]|uniref:Uncharacterized protein n=1 Tax=Paxillus rubicundulus Ve08.2h10 TaxID=930991 RepID=A0A0D0E488_9AGAM|nr:hypothetical protein PAXRUDRAFT_575712 [Paxillus rubicundulus Ve08.2h10]